jgi:hypothetical protein
MYRLVAPVGASALPGRNPNILQHLSVTRLLN